MVSANTIVNLNDFFVDILFIGTTGVNRKPRH